MFAYKFRRKEDIYKKSEKGGNRVINIIKKQCYLPQTNNIAINLKICFTYLFCIFSVAYLLKVINNCYKIITKYY